MNGRAGSRLLPWLLPLALLVASCQSGADVLGYLVERIDTAASTDSKPVNFTVKPGDNADAIARNLEEKRLIKSASVFRVLVQYYGVDKDLQAGEYELRPNATSTEIIATISHGTVRSTTVTIPEGWRMEEVAQLLEKKGIFDAKGFLRVAQEGKFEYEFLASRPSQGGLEGFLFPDTYRIPSRFNAEDFINRMLKNFDTRVPAAMRQKASAGGMSILEVVTLASIVEREAVLASERPIIASVFLNRLREGMPLAADPTVQYALTSNPDSIATYGYWKTELTNADLEISSPYNTYRNTGLPPAPICNPGLASITAVLGPATTDYLYFVAKDDGSHAFSATFEEHARNVRSQNR